MFAVDLLTVEEIKFGIIASGDFRQVGNNLLLPSLRLAFLDELFQRLEVAVAFASVASRNSFTIENHGIHHTP